MPRDLLGASSLSRTGTRLAALGTIFSTTHCPPTAITISGSQRARWRRPGAEKSRCTSESSRHQVPLHISRALAAVAPNASIARLDLICNAPLGQPLLATAVAAENEHLKQTANAYERKICGLIGRRVPTRGRACAPVGFFSFRHIKPVPSMGDRPPYSA